MIARVKRQFGVIGWHEFQRSRGYLSHKAREEIVWEGRKDTKCASIPEGCDGDSEDSL